MKSRNERVALAVETLETLLRRGREFPDASVSAAITHGITADEVRAAYDEALEQAWQELQDDREARHEEGVARALAGRY